MKALDFEEAIGLIDDRIIMELVSTLNNESKIKQKKKVFRTVLIAAVIASMMITAAYAARRLINSPQQAWKAAQQEVATWKSLGLLSSEVTLADQPDSLMECPAQDGGEYWYGRLFAHRYAVGSIGDKYSIRLEVDTFTGKLTKLSIEAYADETDTPARTETAEDGTVCKYYANYDDIVSPDITVDQFCSLLAEYWGFSGYTLSGTQDAFYGYNTGTPDGDMPLTELDDEAYLTVYFDGDQSGVPMYVQLAQLPGFVYLSAGTNHLVG